jgi:hypothetical protein
MIQVQDGDQLMTPEQAFTLAEQNDRAADTLARQGFLLSARRVRKTANQWREVAMRLLVQQREV